MSRSAVIAPSSWFAFVFSLTFASLTHAEVLPYDAVDARPGGGGGRGALQLTGANVVPGPGDPSGAVSGTLSFNRSQLCFEFTVSSLAGRITHIGVYRGAAGATGAEVVVLNPMPPGIMGLRGCVPVDRAVGRQISGDKANYYVMIVTDAHPNGAVRAQLGR